MVGDTGRRRRLEKDLSEEICRQLSNVPGVWCFDVNTLDKVGQSRGISVPDVVVYRQAERSTVQVAIVDFYEPDPNVFARGERLRKHLNKKLKQVQNEINAICGKITRILLGGVQVEFTRAFIHVIRPRGIRTVQTLQQRSEKGYPQIELTFCTKDRHSVESTINEIRSTLGIR